MTASRPTASHRSGAAAVALLLAAATVLGGCSSSSAGSGHIAPVGAVRSSSAAVPTSAATASGAAPTTGAAPTSSPTSATPTSATPPAATPPAGGAVAGGTEFCAQAKTLQEEAAKSASAMGGDTPAALQKLEQQFFDELPHFLAIAPDALKGDMQVIVTAEQKIYAALAAVHFDVRKMDMTTLSGMDTPAFEKATTAIDAYLTKSCGISLTPSG